MKDESATDRALAKIGGRVLAPGRMVVYRTPNGNLVPAIVAATLDTERKSQDVQAQGLTSEEHVHLYVLDPFTDPTGQGYFELDAPFSESGEQDGAWSWPEIKQEQPAAGR